MLPDRVSNPGPLTYESGALPIALRGSAEIEGYNIFSVAIHVSPDVCFILVFFPSF